MNAPEPNKLEPNIRPDCTDELTAGLRRRIVVIVGAMGTAIQRDRPDEAGYRGERFKDWPSDLVGNNDLLTLTQPHIIAGIHREYLDAGADIIEMARERKLRPIEVAKVYFRLADALHAPWLREQIEALKVEGRWHAVARGVLRDELFAQLRALTAQVLAMPGKEPDAKVQAWLTRDDSSLRFTLAMLTELAAQKGLDYPTASVAVQRVAQLAQRG